MVHLYPAHEIMLCRNHRYAFLRHVIPVFRAMLNNIRKMAEKLFMRNRPEILPDKLRPVFFHLLQNLLCKKIPRKKFIGKPLHILSIELCSLAADRFRNQEAPVLLVSRVEGCRMHLDVVHMFRLNTVLQCNRNRIAGQLTEICRMTVESSDAARRKDRVVCLNDSQFSVRIANDRAAAPARRVFLLMP